MTGAPIVACKRCKARKLKCDGNTITCKNCLKAGAECLQIDARSRREYPRDYIENLQQRISYLNTVIATKSSPTTSAVASAISPVAQSTYHGEGSAISIGRLVEAAIAPSSTRSGSVVEIGTTQGHNPNSTVEASPASLPSKKIAEDLVYSYLNGPHKLHPFLLRSSLFRELDGVYSQAGSMSESSLFRIYMVLAIGAVSLVRDGLHDTQAMDYYVAAMRHADSSLSMSNMEHIQSLLLVLLFSLQHDIGIGNKWDLAQVAMRICVENNYHRECRQSGDPMETQMKRRVFWACYINDRHSTSVLGRPLALQDEDIDVQLPIDADDDLIESGNVEAQVFRGMSEVSAQLRQIRLRQITASIGTTLYRRPANHNLYELETAIGQISANLSDWRRMFPVAFNPRNVYETAEWRDLNFYRERMKCYRPMVLLGKGNDIPSYRESLEICQEASYQVGSLYQNLRASDKLVLNWTCVHDMMSAGFTTLYCAVLRRDLPPLEGTVELSWEEMVFRTQESISCITDTLSHIATKWPTVGRHISVFKALAKRVMESVSPGTSASTEEDIWPRMMISKATTGVSDLTNWDGESFGHHAEVWDAAMVSFLNEPFDLWSIDWGEVDWDNSYIAPMLEEMRRKLVKWQVVMSVTAPYRDPHLITETSELSGTGRLERRMTSVNNHSTQELFKGLDHLEAIRSIETI